MSRVLLGVRDSSDWPVGPIRYAIHQETVVNSGQLCRERRGCTPSWTWNAWEWWPGDIISTFAVLKLVDAEVGARPDSVSYVNEDKAQASSTHTVRTRGGGDRSWTHGCMLMKTHYACQFALEYWNRISADRRRHEFAATDRHWRSPFSCGVFTGFISGLFASASAVGEQGRDVRWLRRCCHVVYAQRDRQTATRPMLHALRYGHGQRNKSTNK